MESKGYVQRRPVIWAVSFCIAAILFTVVFGGLRLRPTGFRGWQTLLPAGVVALTVLLGFVWQYRVRTARRWKAVLDSYAEREIARARRREAVPIVVKADDRNSNSLQSLKDRLAGELSDLAYPVILRQGIQGFSIDVELVIWKAIDGTLHELLQPLLARSALTPPASGIVLARLAQSVYRVVQRRGFRGTFADVEFGLWDAFHAKNLPGHTLDRLHALFRRAREDSEARRARPHTARADSTWRLHHANE
jgi:hypothetical protein